MLNQLFLMEWLKYKSLQRLLINKNPLLKAKPSHHFNILAVLTQQPPSLSYYHSLSLLFPFRSITFDVHFALKQFKNLI